MKVSVIIPVYNEEKVVGECLESLANQTHKDFEVIVVDDGSTDKTLDVLSSIKYQACLPARQVLSIRILKQKHKGPGAARNLGASKAKGKVLVFVDADMVFRKDFLEKLVRPIERGRAKGTFSKEEYVGNWDNIWARCWNINKNLPPKHRLPKNYPNKQKVFRAILKSEFDRVGGFEPGGYTDDYSLYEKLGYKAKKATAAIFFHNNPDNLKEVFMQAKWVGKRKYKLGVFGYAIALARSSLPVSLLIGLIKAVTHKLPAFFVSKIIYDFGIFVGIIEFIVFRKGSK